jgi:flagellar motor switch protein FliM
MSKPQAREMLSLPSAPRIPAAQLDKLRQVSEDFARSLGPLIEANLHCDCPVEFSGAREAPFRSLHPDLEGGGYVAALTVSPKESNGVLLVSQALAYPLLEALMGGKPASAADLNRRFTRVEEVLLEGLFSLALHELGRCWRDPAHVEFKLQPTQPGAGRRDLFLGSEVMLVLMFTLSLAGSLQETISIAVPASLIQCRANESSEAAEAGGCSVEQSHGRIEALVLPAQVELDIRLEGPSLQMKALDALETGQLLVLDLSLEQSVAGYVNGVRKFNGQVVSDGKQRLYLIDAFVTTAGISAPAAPNRPGAEAAIEQLSAR